MPKNFPDSITALFEEICDPGQPLPIPRMVGRHSEWARFLAFVGNRVKGALYALVTHPTDPRMSHLYIGGDLGVMPMVRMLEFMRRCLKTESLRGSFDGINDVEALVSRTETVLGKEMWRRWASDSFVRIRHLLGGKLCGYWHIYIEAVLHCDRESPEEVCLPLLFD